MICSNPTCPHCSSFSDMDLGIELCRAEDAAALSVLLHARTESPLARVVALSSAAEWQGYAERVQAAIRARGCDVDAVRLAALAAREAAK